MLAVLVVVATVAGRSDGFERMSQMQENVGTRPDEVCEISSDSGDLTADNLPDVCITSAPEYALTLQESYRELQRAHYKRGYLESWLKNQRGQVEASRLADKAIKRYQKLICQNDELVAIEQASKLASLLSEQNETFREIIRFTEMAHRSRWSRLKDLLSGMRISAVWQRPRPYQMKDYYELLQRQLK